MGWQPINVTYRSPSPEAEAWIADIMAMIDRNAQNHPRIAHVWKTLLRMASHADVIEITDASRRIGVTPNEIADALVGMRDVGLLEYEATPGTSCILVAVCAPGRNPRAAM
jgi:hypothetical protein